MHLISVHHTYHLPFWQAFGEFEIVVFGDEVILNQSIEEWPMCDALLSWHSEGFPLKKVRSRQAPPSWFSRTNAGNTNLAVW